MRASVLAAAFEISSIGTCSALGTSSRLGYVIAQCAGCFAVVLGTHELDRWSGERRVFITISVYPFVERHAPAMPRVPSCGSPICGPQIHIQSRVLFGLTLTLSHEESVAWIFSQL
ncbi:hypothetical protein BC833DRAFT_570461 [Globomyces pollinis-pini]|nr:hypothetical protein BC833DRAFT_570461 [Globomyces pollinis-pini]